MYFQGYHALDIAIFILNTGIYKYVKIKDILKYPW